MPTASGDAEGYVDRFVEAFAGRAETSSLSLFHLAELAERGEEVDLRAHVLAQDVIYVGGGSTANLLALWRLHGLDGILAEAAAAGVVLAGIGAGMNCWFEGSVTDCSGPSPGCRTVSVSSPAAPARTTTARPSGARRTSPGGDPCAARGVRRGRGCALLFRDGELVEAVSSRPDARAFRVHLSGAGLDVLDGMEAPEVARDPVEVRYLG